MIDAAQIASPRRHAMPAEEFENLDGDFAAIVETIPERCGGELPVRRLGGQIDRNFRHFGDGAAKKEMVLGYFMNFAETAKQLAEPAYLGLGAADHAAHVTNPRRARAFVAGKQRSYITHRSADLGRTADCLRTGSCCRDRTHDC